MGELRDCIVNAAVVASAMVLLVSVLEVVVLEPAKLEARGGQWGCMECFSWLMLASNCKGPSLDAPSHLYAQVYPSGPSVGDAFVKKKKKNKQKIDVFQ